MTNDGVDFVIIINFIYIALFRVQSNNRRYTIIVIIKTIKCTGLKIIINVNIKNNIN